MCPAQEDYAIELFQLENLIDNRVPFLFFALLKQKPASCPAKVDHYMQHASIVSEAEMEQQVKTKNKDTPIVLICEDGKHSRTLAGQMQKKGFTNVFFVAGGLQSIYGS